MKPLKLLANLVLVLLLVGALSVTPLLLSTESKGVTPVQDRVKAATHVISTATLTEESNCSATAIARHALLTASHCESPSDLLSIDGVPGYRITATVRDGNDHTILLIAGIAFESFVPLGFRELRSAEHVFIWGNPSLNGVVYIKQLHEGTYRASHVHKGRIVDVLGFQSYHGDSGSGVFTSAGELLGVVSFIGSIPLPTGEVIAATGAVRLAFSKADRERAVSFK